jgi:hypothetical protein
MITAALMLIVAMRRSGVHSANIEIGNQSLFGFVKRGWGQQSEIRRKLYKSLRREGMSAFGASDLSMNDLLIWEVNVICVENSREGAYYKVVEYDTPGCFRLTAAFVRPGIAQLAMKSVA